MGLGAPVVEFDWDSEYFSSAAAGPIFVLKLGSRFLVIQERPEHDWNECPRALLPDSPAVKSFVESIIKNDFDDVEGVEITNHGFEMLADLPELEAKVSSLADEYWRALIEELPEHEDLIMPS